MREWRKALKRASYIKGFVVKAKDCNSDDSQLVDKVVERVLKELPKTPLNVSLYPVGLADKVEDLERRVLIPQQSGKTRVVGIVGLGGVGKTTLAKEIYNRERSKYHRSYFLFDVRQKALHSLQRDLLKELTGSEVKIENRHEGIEELRRRVSSCNPHALIILDDVDNIDQRDALLLPVKDALSPSSLILVTSRNKDVLTSFGIVETSIYRLEGLNPQHSQELFCKHAFGQRDPVAQFGQVVEEFLNACQGLPLSLQVIGASLHGKADLKYWKEKLLKISKILPEDIQSILKISYDCLDEDDKQIFLDIACFFTGEKRNEENDIERRPDMDTAIRIWDGSGLRGWLGFWNLQNRCLVDVEEDIYTKIQYLRMHDHVRDLGRYLAKKEPLGGHRLWQPTEIHNLSDQSAVRGLLCLKRSQLGNRSIRMSKLELLITRGDCLKDILKRVEPPVYLIWLHCHGFPSDLLPRCIPMKRLRVLDVQGYKLKRLWLDSQVPLQLTQLKITAPLLKFPKSIGQLKYLEKIVVQGNPYTAEIFGRQKVPLKSLPDEFCDLQCLKHLELNRCSEMKSLPESFGKLKKLEHLDFSGCSNLQTLPNSFGKLIQLKRLCLSSCSSLTMSSETLGKITTLEVIDIAYCKNIEELPPQVADQRHLSALLLGYTKIREFPSAIRYLRVLKFLDIGKCLPDSIEELTQLEELRLMGTDVECLSPCIMALNNLQSLEVVGSSLRELPFKRIGEERETRRDSPRGSEPDALIGCMRGLTCILLFNINISEIAFGKGVCPNLQRLEIHWCSFLREVGTLPNTLTDLKLRRNSRLEKIEGLCGVEKLQTLKIKECPKVEELSGVETLISLVTLEVYKCGFTSIQGLQKLIKLRVLKVTKCEKLEKLAGIEHLLGSEMLIIVCECPLRCGEEVLEELKKRAEKDLPYKDDDSDVSSEEHLDNVSSDEDLPYIDDDSDVSSEEDLDNVSSDEDPRIF
jgi:Leucine-rich repeat (LRR) protein